MTAHCPHPASESVLSSSHTLNNWVIKGCPVISWWTKNSSHSINILDIVTQVAPLYLKYTKRHHMNLISHWWHHFLWHWLIWACYLFFSWHALPAVHTNSRMNNMLKRANVGKNHARLVKLGAYIGAWYTEYNGTAVYIKDIDGMRWFLVHHDIIWQTLQCIQGHANL